MEGERPPQEPPGEPPNESFAKKFHPSIRSQIRKRVRERLGVPPQEPKPLADIIDISDRLPKEPPQE